MKNRLPRLFALAVNQESSVEEMERLGWSEGGGVWVWRRRLLAWEGESVRKCSVLLLNIILQEQISDRWK